MISALICMTLFVTIASAHESVDEEEMAEVGYEVIGTAAGLMTSAREGATSPTQSVLSENDLVEATRAGSLLERDLSDRIVQTAVITNNASPVSPRSVAELTKSDLRVGFRPPGVGSMFSDDPYRSFDPSPSPAKEGHQEMWHLLDFMDERGVKHQAMEPLPAGGQSMQGQFFHVLDWADDSFSLFRLAFASGTQDFAIRPFLQGGATAQPDSMSHGTVSAGPPGRGSAWPTDDLDLYAVTHDDEQPPSERLPHHLMHGASTPWTATTSTAATAAGSGLVFFAAAALYSVLSRKDALKNDIRAKICAFLEEHPGSTITRLAEVSGVTHQTATYHLKLMKRMGYVIEHKKGNALLFFLNGTGMVAEKREAVGLTRDETAMKLLRIVVEDPGIGKKDAAEAIGLTRTAGAWHIRKLVTKGLIREERQHGRCSLFPEENKIDELREMILRGSYGIESILVNLQPSPAPS